jgi:hypothetical protein
MILGANEVKFVLLFSAAIAALSSPAMAQGLVGTDVAFAHQFGLLASSPSTHTVANGTADAALIDFGTSGYLANLDENSLTIDFFAPAPTRLSLAGNTFIDSSPNGLVLSSASYDFASIISSLNITNTGGFGFTNSRVSQYGSNGILFDFAGMDYTNASGFTATFSNVSAVPEPATWALMLVGFGAVGASMRSRTRTKASLGVAA